MGRHQDRPSGMLFFDAVETAQNPFPEILEAFAPRRTGQAGIRRPGKSQFPAGAVQIPEAEALPETEVNLPQILVDPQLRPRGFAEGGHHPGGGPGPPQGAGVDPFQGDPPEETRHPFRLPAAQVGQVRVAPAADVVSLSDDLPMADQVQIQGFHGKKISQKGNRMSLWAAVKPASSAISEISQRAP